MLFPLRRTLRIEYDFHDFTGASISESDNDFNDLQMPCTLVPAGRTRENGFDGQPLGGMMGSGPDIRTKEWSNK
jgi:hypothetical protein